MKVICIDDKPRPGEMEFLNVNGELKEGLVYSVIAKVTGYSIDDNGRYVNPKPCYRLAEINVPTDICFEQNRFIPLSQINESTFERNYQKEFI